MLSDREKRFLKTRGTLSRWGTPVFFLFLFVVLAAYAYFSFRVPLEALCPISGEAINPSYT